MIYDKRVVVATSLGAVIGLAGMNVEAFLIGGSFTLGMMAELFLNRTLIGVFIGISGWKRTHWVWHGSIIGFLMSLPIAVPQGFTVAATLIVLGTLYGTLIEYITVKFFKAPIAA